MNGELVVLAWPEDASEVERLRKLKVPRLLLVSSDGEPPPDPDHLLDWVRVPANEREVAARVVGLMRRAEAAASEVAVPRVDVNNRFHYGNQWVPLSPIEAQIASELSSRFTQVVAEAALVRSAWPAGSGEAPRIPALRVHLTRLRRRIDPLGLQIVALRSQGVILQPLPVSTS